MEDSDMTKLDISIPEATKAFIDDRIASGAYQDANEYFRALVEKDQNQSLRSEIDAKLLEAARSQATAMTQAVWEDIRREGMRILDERAGR
jgi:antitoxin ParD1/3/4